MLEWQAWYTAGVVLVMLVALVREVARPDIVLLGCLGLLLAAGIVPPEVAFGGFSNPAVLTIAALFIVAAGIQRTNALAPLDYLLFSKKGVGIEGGLLRMMGATAAMSAFVNNTPLVAMLIPRVQAWAERDDIPPSKVMMPLSYAAVLGGTITLIGTSTNLVVSGILLESVGRGLGMFDLTWAGLPAATAAILFFSFIGQRLLPGRRASSAQAHATVDYYFELRVSATSPIAGQNVSGAALRSLQHAYLKSIRRGEHVIAPVTPQEVLQAHDVLCFTGSAAVMDRLLERPGLERAVDGLSSNGTFRPPLFEAVVSASSSLAGRTLKEVDFRNRFQGVVVAIQRRDEEIKEALGGVRLKPGDLLVIEAGSGFQDRWDRNEFYLVAPLRAMRPAPRRKKAPIALALFGAMVLSSAIGWVPLVTAAFAAALGMVFTKCLHVRELREEVDISILVMIAAALGIGAAIEASGLAEIVAGAMVTGTAGLGPLATLVAVYVTTNIFTELLTNSAAAALIAPVAIAAALQLGADPVPYAVAVAIAASSGFSTPFGYQTNLMVMGVGGYRMKDYVVAGLPLNLVVMIVAVAAIWIVWF